MESVATHSPTSTTARSGSATRSPQTPTGGVVPLELSHKLVFLQWQRLCGLEFRKVVRVSTFSRAASLGRYCRGVHVS